MNRKLHVYIVHEEYERKSKKTGSYRILGVYLDKGAAELHRLNVEHDSKGYISVTKHSCRGYDRLVWKYLLEESGWARRF